MSFCPHCDETHGDGVDFCPKTGRPIVDIVDRMIGRTIAGKYRLIKSIGQGGMGTIFEAEHTMIGNHVAVKLLHQPFAEKREPVMRLYREAKATGAIGHPNIIKVHDVGETTDGVPFLVMELLKGESLGERIEREGPQPLGFVTEVAGQVLSALHAAHEAGIIHRDLKSDNIFLLESPEGTIETKILDFGISKFVSPEMENLKLTQTGSVLGTPYYMSPEQAQGKKGMDHRIDIYAAGVILYETLVGTIPHTASNYNALLIEILTEDVKPFRWLRPDVPEELEATILKALSRNPDSRWSSAVDFMEAVLASRERLSSDELHSPPVIRRELSISGRNSRTMDINDVSLEEIGDIPLAFETGNRSTWGRLAASPKGKAALWVGASFLLLISVALVFFWLFSGNRGDGSLEVGVGDVSSTLSSDAGADVGSDESVDMVRLVVNRVPETAVVTVDEIEVPAIGMDLARTGITMKLVVSAEGHVTKRLDIVPTVDLDLDVVLDPISETSAAASDDAKKGGGKKGGGNKGGGKKGGGKKGGGKKPPKEKGGLDRPMDNPF